MATVGIRYYNSIPRLIGYPFNDSSLEHGSSTLPDGLVHDYVTIYQETEDKYTFTAPTEFTVTSQVEQVEIQINGQTVTRDKQTDYRLTGWGSDVDGTVIYSNSLTAEVINPNDVTKNIVTVYAVLEPTVSARFDFYDDDTLIDVQYKPFWYTSSTTSNVRFDSTTTTVPTREGHIFSGWLNENVRYTAGYTLFTEYADNLYTTDTYTDDTVVPVRMDATYDLQTDTVHSPTTLVRIFGEEDDDGLSDYTDVSRMLSVAPVITRVENQPGSARFTLLNRYDGDSSKLLTSDDYQWRFGTECAVRCGMAVHIYNLRDNDGNFDLVFDGIISTMTVNGDTISFECADGIAVLGKAGSDIRRNYRSGEIAGWFDAQYAVQSDGSYKVWAVLDDTMDDGSMVTPVSYGWMMDEDGEGYVFTGSNEVTVVSGQGITKGQKLFDWKFNDTYGGGKFTYIHSLRIRCSGRFITTVGIKLYAKIGEYESGTAFNNDGYYTFEWENGAPVNGDITVSVYSGNGAATTSASWEITTFYGSASDSTITFGSTTINGAPDVKLVRGITHMSISGEWKVENNRNVFYPSSTSKDMALPTSKRLYVTYVKETVSVPDIVADILNMLQSDSIFPDLDNQCGALPSSAGALAVYRIGGGFVADYLRKLADCYDKEGDYKGIRRAFTVEGGQRCTVRLGRRYTAEDDPLFCLHYGGDVPDELPESVIDSFAYSSANMSKTIKHRPNKVTYYADLSDSSDNSSLPITIIDATSRDLRGVLTASIGTGSSASWQEAVQSCYNEISSNELDKWEGTVTIPMSSDARSHLTEYIQRTGDYAGSGVPVIIYDRRYGMDGYRARVRQMVADYSSCTITFTLNNYSMAYSSDISDSIALAVGKGTAGAVVNTTLWARQYIYKYLENGGNITVGDDLYVCNANFISTPTKTVKADKTEWAKLPDGDYLVIGRWSVTTSNEFGGKYMAKSLRIGNKRVDIRNCADFLNGQTLVACVQIKGLT